MLYSILKFVIKIALKVFFKSVKVKNQDLIPDKGPMIVVSNHPNTFMDPIILASLLKPQVHFLANASIFNSSFTKWLFAKLNMIPIQRKHDTNKEKFDNNKIFEKCYEFLGKKGTIMIFPEGTSIRVRRLQQIKTGTARIALGAEENYNFDLGLKIVTIGLNYSKPESFRSEVFVSVDEPIDVSKYKEIFLKDEFEAARQLTEEIRSNLEEHIIITSNDEEDRLAHQIEEVYKHKLSKDIQLSPEEKEQDYLITKGIVDAVRHFEEKEPERIKDFKPKIHNYLKNLKRLDLSDEVFIKEVKNQGLFWASLQTAVYFIIGFPLFIYGSINNYIPYIIPSKVAIKLVKMTEVEEYMAPVMLITGIFTFSFFYILQIVLMHLIFGNWWITLAYFVSLPISGFFALFYANYLYDARDNWRLFTLFFKRASLVSSLIEQRKNILKVLEKAKEDYLAFYQKEEQA